MNVSELKSNPNNPRTISGEKLELLCNSIREFPKMMELRPIVIDSDGVVLGGNMRLKALRRLGYKEIPDTWVKRADELSESERQRFIIEDNVAFGEWDFDVLASEWDTELLADWGLDLPAEFTQEKDDDVAEEDDFDEEKDFVATRCQLGDVWQLGRHRLMCGDSTNEHDVQRLAAGAEADLLVTDPPYNVDYEGGTPEKMKIENDNMADGDFRAFLTKAFTVAQSIMRPGACFYIWHADSEGYNFRSACKEAGLKVRQCLIWRKNALVMGRQDYQWQHEPCLYGWKAGGAHTWNSDRKQTTVLDFDKPLKNDLHPTMKPVPLFDYQIRNNTKQGQLVFDLFAGSGTTIVACEQNKRNAYCMELDPHYCDVILARWEKLTGEQAVKL